MAIGGIVLGRILIISSLGLKRGSSLESLLGYSISTSNRNSSLKLLGYSISRSLFEKPSYLSLVFTAAVSISTSTEALL